MAQHRTKEDKQAAQQHRFENSKLYSLTSIEKGPTLSKKVVEASVLQKTGVDLTYVRKDLLRTAISIVIVLILLGAGVYYLN